MNSSCGARYDTDEGITCTRPVGHPGFIHSSVDDAGTNVGWNDECPFNGRALQHSECHLTACPICTSRCRRYPDHTGDHVLSTRDGTYVATVPGGKKVWHLMKPVH